MMLFIYTIAIRFYFFLILLSSIFNPKAKKWINGRRDWKKKMAQTIEPGSSLVWFHAASLGEFEQGRPVIEVFRKTQPHFKILLTFFSPSGYEVRKDYDGADYVYYLPLDTPSSARRFIELVKPRVAVFIKYEYWFNYLTELNKKAIPVLIISAIFRPEQVFFRWYGSWFLNQLKKINLFFVQNTRSAELLSNAGINQVIISGDTRFDRVASIVANQKDNKLVEVFSVHQKVILGGSTWHPDEKLLAEFLKSTKVPIKLIIAPHEIHEERIRSIEHLFGNFNPVRYSRADQENMKIAGVLIIDGIGFLSGLYRYCYIAYIGGGFGRGIHNILEAVTFGKPVLFGPEYKNFSEAIALIKKGGAFPILNQGDMNLKLEKLLDDYALYQQTTQVCKTYISENIGATKIILEAIEKKFLQI